MGKLNVNLKNNIKAAYHAATSRPIKLLQKKKPNDDLLPLRDNAVGILNKSITLKKNIDKNKKAKFRRKHKKLLEKIVLVKKQQKEDKARKNRERSGGIVGDLKPLKDALPSLDELFKLSKAKENLRTGIMDFKGSPTDVNQQRKINVKERLKLKREHFVQQVTSYEALLNDPDFKRNPREAIKYHIEQKYALHG